MAHIIVYSQLKILKISRKSAQHLKLGGGGGGGGFSPLSPPINYTLGQAERFVRRFKQAIRAGERESLPLDQRLQNFLLMDRVTLHATTGVSPCKFFLGRDLRTRLHMHAGTTSWKYGPQ